MGTPQEKRRPGGRLATLFGSRRRVVCLSAALAAGLLLLMLGNGVFSRTSTETGTDTALDTAAETEALEAWRAALEAELAALCDAVDGVSGSEVTVGLSRGVRRRYVTDAEGRVVTVGNGSAAHALPESVEPPAVAGVGIVCRGGSRPAVQKTLIELVSTALGIPSSRVFVAGK